MLGEWLQPLCDWFGLGLIPLLLIVIVLILIFKGD